MKAEERRPEMPDRGFAALCQWVQEAHEWQQQMYKWSETVQKCVQEKCPEAAFRVQADPPKPPPDPWK